MAENLHTFEAQCPAVSMLLGVSDEYPDPRVMRLGVQTHPRETESYKVIKQDKYTDSLRFWLCFRSDRDLSFPPQDRTDIHRQILGAVGRRWDLWFCLFVERIVHTFFGLPLIGAPVGWVPLAVGPILLQRR